MIDQVYTNKQNHLYYSTNHLMRNIIWNTIYPDLLQKQLNTFLTNQAVSSSMFFRGNLRSACKWYC